MPKRKVDNAGDWSCAVSVFTCGPAPVLPCMGSMGATDIRLSLRLVFFRGWKMAEESGAAHRENASVRVLLPDK